MKLIKIGGGKAINIGSILSELKEIDEKYIIIVGANAYRDELADRLGLEIKRVLSISGQSSVQTDENGIDLINMVYAGSRSKKIVELLYQNGINAVSLTGLDGNLIQGTRNKGVRIIENGKKKILHDRSGKPLKLNKDLLDLLLNAGYVPVISIPIFDENYNAINTDNDAIIRLLHSEYNFTEIWQFIESEGIYEDYSNKSTLLKEISAKDLGSLENKLQDGMRRKIHEVRNLIEIYPTTIYVGDGRSPRPIEQFLKKECTIIS